jgi:uncharacterized protein
VSSKEFRAVEPFKEPPNAQVSTSGSGPRVTAELFTIPLDRQRWIIYAPLRQAAFIANAKFVNFIADLKDGRYEPSADPDGSIVEFLRRLEIVDSNVERRPVTSYQGDPSPTSVTLFLTTACNLRCTYCYASAGDTPLKMMSLETARRGISFVAQNAFRKGESSFDVSYHGGGEPTANWHVMTASREFAGERAKELGLGVRAASATNGVLRDDQIDWILINLDNASVSFDGLPEVHDASRLTVLQSGSSARVMHTMKRFDDARFDYGIRVTVTHDHIARLPDSVEFICAHFRAPGIQVEPAYQLGRWSGAPSAETEEFLEAYRSAQVRASRYGKQISYSAVRLDTLTNHFCGISQDSFALSPDGNVSACYEAFSEDNAFADVFFYGKPDEKTASGYKFRLPILNNLRHQSVENRSFCQGCFAKWHCAGDCYHKALAQNGRRTFEGSGRCHVTRELTKDQLLSRIRDAGGVCWLGQQPASAEPSQCRAGEVDH